MTDTYHAYDVHRALKAFHYLAPATFALSYVSALIIALVHRQRAPKKYRHAQRRLSLWLMVAVLAVLVCEEISLLAQILKEGIWSLKKDENLYIHWSLLAWACLTKLLHGNPAPVWTPYVSGWLVAAASDIPTLALTFVDKASRSRFGMIRAVLLFVRVLLVVTLVMEGLDYERLRKSKKTRKSKKGESQPLLAPESQENLATGDTYGSANDPETGTTSNSDEDSEDEDLSGFDWPDDRETNQKIRRERYRAIKEKGGWIGYLASFKVFLPLIWPSGDRVLHICIVLTVICLVINSGLGVIIPLQVGRLTDALTHSSVTGRFPLDQIIIWVALQVGASSAGVSMIQSLLKSELLRHLTKNFQLRAYQHIMGLSMDFHTSKSTSEITYAFHQASDMVDLVDFALFRVGRLLLDLSLALVYFCWYFDAYVSYIVVATSIIYVWIALSTTAIMMPQRRKFIEVMEKKWTTQYEGLEGWLTVSYFNRHTYENERYGQVYKDYQTADRRYYNTMTLLSGGQSVILDIARAVIVTKTGYEIYKGDVTIGQLVSLLQFWSNLTLPLGTIASQYKLISQRFVNAEKLLALLQTKVTIVDKEGAPPLKLDEGKVEFKNVSFAYDPRKQALKNVSFTAEGGKIIAFVGETGGGKSTLMKLIPRFYDVGSGSVTIDGQDIRDVSVDSLREIFGVVSQDPSLFNQTIMENVRYARLNATDEEVYEACKAAAIHDKIMTFPDKYQAKVGDRGLKLSGGEKQRIAIARAILKDPKIVLLDEATSAVDTDTRAAIQDALDKLCHNRTTFIVAHRLGTVIHADLILVVQDGEIIERGTHDELSKEGSTGKYRSLWSKQIVDRRKAKQKVLDLNVETMTSGETTAENSDDESKKDK